MQSIQFKRSNKAGAIPAPTAIGEGEIALNLHDHVIHTKDAQGQIVQISVSPEKHQELIETVAANKQESVSALKSAKTELNTKIDGIKTATDAKIEENHTAINTKVDEIKKATDSTIASNKALAQSRLDSAVSSLTETIETNKQSADAALDALADTVERNKLSIEGEVAANKTHAQNQLDAAIEGVNETITANRSEAKKDIADLTDVVNRNKATTDAVIEANKQLAQDKLDEAIAGINADIAGNIESLDRRFVNASGDRMTGELIAPKITCTGEIQAQDGIRTVGGFVVERDSYPNLRMTSKNIDPSVRHKLIEVDTAGGLNIITRNEGQTNNGVVTIAAGKSGEVYHTGNKPTHAELNVDRKGQVWVNDRRDLPAMPNDFPDRALTTWFDTKNVPSNTWHSGINVKGWEGGNYASWQLFSYASIGVNPVLYFRNANADGTAWNETHEIYHTGRKPTKQELGLDCRFWGTSDMPLGTLIETDIDASVEVGDSFTVDILGKNYLEASAPLQIIAEGYLYQNTFFACSSKIDGTFDGEIFFLKLSNGKLGIWFQHQGYWKNYGVTVYRTNAGEGFDYNHVTAIRNSGKPSSDKIKSIPRHYTYGTHRPPAPVDIGALSRNGDTMNGTFTLNGTQYIDCRSGRQHLAFKVTDSVTSWIYCDPNDSTIKFSSDVRLENGRLSTAGNVDAGGEVTTRNGNFVSYNGAGANSHVWFRNAATGAERAVIYAGDDGVLRLRNNAAGFQRTHNFYNEMIQMTGGEATGDQTGLIRGAIQGGAWGSWQSRSAGLLVDCQNSDGSAYNVWKATHWGARHIAAMQVHWGGIGYAKLNVGGSEFTFQGDGDMVAGRNGNFNDVYIRSDSRLKINRERIENALGKINDLTVYTYDKLDSLKAIEGKSGDDLKEHIVNREVGIIAQDLQKVLPEAVTVQADDTHVISNSGVNALLVQGVQELDTKVEAIIAENQELKAKNAELEERLAKLEALIQQIPVNPTNK